MSTKTCEFPTGNVWSGPKVCGRPAKYVTQTDDNHHWFGGGKNVCGIHKRPATRYGHITVAPIAKEHQ